MLALFSDYPGDPALHAYLKCAIRTEQVSVNTFIRTFLFAANSLSMHNVSTLDMLCKLALDCHYDPLLNPSGSPPFPKDPPIVISDAVRNGMALLKIACEISSTHFHELTESASSLLLLLLASVSDYVAAQFTPNQIVTHIADARDLASHPRIPPHTKQMLEQFALSLSFLLGDDAKAAREAQMMHSTLGRSQTIVPNSDSDIVSCSLLLRSLVTQSLSLTCTRD